MIVIPTKKQSDNKKQPYIITIPTIASYDGELFDKYLKEYDTLIEADADMSELFQRLIVDILDSIIAQLKVKSRFKIKKYKNGDVAYKFKSYECSLCIYVQNGSLSYMVHVNTVNYETTLECLYFTPKHMFGFLWGIVLHMTTDFTELIRECCDLQYAFEYTHDTIPRGTHKDGVPFYALHEYKILKERHYYDGYLNYESGHPCIDDELPFDKWLDELETEKR